MGFEQAWLTYTKKEGYADIDQIRCIYADAESAVMKNAVKELRDALMAFTGRAMEVYPLSDRTQGAAGRIASVSLVKREGCEEEGYRLCEERGSLVVEAPDERGILYGTFALIFRMQRQEPLAGLDLVKEPVMPLRWWNTGTTWTGALSAVTPDGLFSLITMKFWWMSAPLPMQGSWPAWGSTGR